MVSYVADVPVEGYNSETRRLEPKVPWLEKKHRLYWLWESESRQYKEPALTAEVEIMMRRMNHTEGLHTFQQIYGCELGENGGRTWFYRDAYDGVDLLTHNGDSVTYMADIHPATVILDRWTPKKIMIQQLKDYLEHPCLTDLQLYLKDGAEHLQKVTPRTMSCRRKTGVPTFLNRGKTRGRTFLIGYAYGFYPREIEVKWFRDGVEIPAESMEILPNPDGTYQVRSMVEVHEGDDEKIYKCQVDHSSLPEVVTVECESRSSTVRNIWSIIGGIAGGVVLAVIIGWIVCQNKYPERRRIRRRTRTVETQPSLPLREDVEKGQRQGKVRKRTVEAQPSLPLHAERRRIRGRTRERTVEAQPSLPLHAGGNTLDLCRFLKENKNCPPHILYL